MIEDINEIKIDNQIFSYLDDQRNGLKLYVNKNRSQYLRLGNVEIIDKEIALHQQLISEGFPIAKIIKKGKWQDLSYWIEESLGEKHLADLFADEYKANGCITEKTFQLFLTIVEKFQTTQFKTLKIPINWDKVYKGVGFGDILKELPQYKTKLETSWTNMCKELESFPAVYCHGDFTSHNILPLGVIDHEDHFEGPFGYDLITAITPAYWFSADSSYGNYARRSQFSPTQKEEFFNRFGIFQYGGKQFNLKDYFSPLFFLKATWWSVRNFKNPKMQEWRYQKYIYLLEKYLEKGDLYQIWLESE
jgi:thiamine kinase-like enzyme